MIEQRKIELQEDMALFRKIDEGNGISGYETISEKTIVHRDGAWRVSTAAKSLDRLFSSLPQELFSLKLVRADRIDHIGLPVFWSRVLCRGNWSSVEPFIQWGKGLSKKQAMMSAASEAIERLCARVLPGTPLVRAAYRDICKKAHDPTLFIQDSTVVRSKHVRFSEDICIEWRRGFDFYQRREVMVPATFVHFPYPVSEKETFANQGTNGLAAGSNFYEAMLQGILELVERDAVYIFLRNRLVAPDIELDGVIGSRLIRLIQKLQQKGISFRIKDYTSDIGIAVIGVILIEKKFYKGPFLTVGFGAHMSPYIAFARAITEAIQSRSYHLNKIRSLSSDEARQYIGHTGLFGAGFENAYECMLHDSAIHRKIDELPSFDRIGIVGALTECIQRICSVQRSKGVIAVNLERPELRFPVIKMIAPGLQDVDHEHYSCSYRMLTLPRILGYINTDISESSIFQGLLP